MKLGQDIEIQGSVSKKIFESIGVIQNKLISWNIGLKKIKVKTKSLTTDDYNSNKKASFFSGGVDSFYTYLKNKNEGVKMDYFILANGFDINLKNKSLWSSTLANIKIIAKKEGVGLIKVESNVRDIIEPIVPWDYSHGGCLASLGLLFRRGLSDVYIASTYTFDQMFPWGSHPELDKYWSTETLSFLHHGADITRLDKVKYISNYPIVLENIRVCYLNPKNQFNCGKCDKCLRTMINFEIAGKLGQLKTFPNKIDLEILKELKIEAGHGAIFHLENLDELKKIGRRKDIQEIVSEKIKNAKQDSQLVNNALRKVMYLDFFYLKGKMYSVLNLFRY